MFFSYLLILYFYINALNYVCIYDTEVQQKLSRDHRGILEEKERKNKGQIVWGRQSKCIMSINKIILMEPSIIYIEYIMPITNHISDI